MYERFFLQKRICNSVFSDSFLKSLNFNRKMSAELRQLKIKAGMVKRLRKELEMYQSELAKEQAKVNTLKDEGAQASDIKYAVSSSRRNVILLFRSPPKKYTASHEYHKLTFRWLYINFQENILAESSAMIPNTRQRLEAALGDLQALIVGDALSLALHCHYPRVLVFC
jgi:tubulin-specific chaperone A